jgi:hypothetical protein
MGILEKYCWNNKMNYYMEKNFKAYSKGYISLDSDSIFSFMGKKEVGMTKSIAALLYHDDEFLKEFLKIIGLEIERGNTTISIFVEQRSEINGGIEKRRDITIKIQKLNCNNTLVVVEAKNPSKSSNNNLDIINQLNDYFNPLFYPDVNKFTRKIGITLTKERIKSNIHGMNYNEFHSLTWEDLVFNLGNKDFENNITNSFVSELKKVNFMKTYDVEIFSPSADKSYNLITELHIYCCPFDRTLKDSIYLMPRIGFNRFNHFLEPFGLNENNNYTGKGFCLEIYKIKTSFIVDSNSLETIEDINIRNNVIQWLNGRQEILKVFVLSDPIPFTSPKFTATQNPRGNVYYDFSEILGNILPQRGNN